MLELRRDHGIGVVTALVRVEGHPFGLVANNTEHLGGAIDATAADKLAAFLTLCDAFGLPVVSLCDTPGFMVGPQAETEASVSRFSRLFIVGARLRVPIGTIILRKGYGLGAQAMAAGSFRAPQFVVAWPTGRSARWVSKARFASAFARSWRPHPTPTLATASSTTTSNWHTSRAVR